MAEAGQSRTKGGKRKWKRVLLAAAVGIAVLCVAAAAFVYAVYDGVILLNNPSQTRYPVRGVDVSHYQGDIDWQVLSGQDIDFAYIKATEGSSHTDDKFLENWEDAEGAGLPIGAYHFFSFDSPGETQLEHFIDVVPAFRKMLPPAVDFEFYADKKVNPPAVDPIVEQLQIMLEGLEEHYGVKPVLYATEESWEMYLRGRFDEYPLWIRDVFKKPDINGQDWLFWQYTNRERLPGYDGEEEYIDVNVFAGSRDEWEFWSRNREQGYDYRLGWGTFCSDERQDSDDGRYTAVQSTVKTPMGEERPLESVKVTILVKETGEEAGSFVADRSRDFWGICWEPGNHDRIWTQSGDVGVRCFERIDDEWRYQPDAERSSSVISKYDTYEEGMFDRDGE